MTRAEFDSLLAAGRVFVPCSEALSWLAERPDATPEELWESCTRAGWLVWLLEGARIGIDLGQDPIGPDRVRAAVSWQTVAAALRGLP